MPGREKIVVAMSGGVDSSVVAAELVEAGHEVVGVFMRNGVKAAADARRGKQGCCSVDDARDARRVAELLDVPFFALDFTPEFGGIIARFADEYDRGRTPNPCILCNRDLKMGRLLQHAREIGADAVATGHYARVVARGGRLAIARPHDRGKDQSYVLFPLSQEQLARTRLPLGERDKESVRDRARELGLGVADKPDSQEICFVPDNDYGALLRRRRPEALRPGRIVDAEGREVGRHEGHQLYTIGQRKGLGGGHGAPVYVTAIRAAENEVVIGPRAELGAAGFRLETPVYSGIADLEPGEEIAGEAQIRSRHGAAPATARRAADGAVEVTFREPVEAVTPGQAGVFYADDTVLLGGFIDGVLTASAVRRG